MNLTKVLNFENPDDWNLPPEVEIVNNKLQLKLIDKPGEKFAQPFTSDTGFTYDSNKTEFVGGHCRQKDQRPSGALCYATYTTDIDLNAIGGSRTGIATGGAAVSGNQLDLGNNDTRYVTYNAVDNADGVQVGAIKFRFIPNYDNSPGTDKTLFFIGKNSTSNNRILLVHRASDGHLVLTISDSTGTSIINQSIGLWQPVALTEYEFELNWDLTTGATRLFIEGTQHGSTLTSTGTRSSDIEILRIGSNQAASTTSDFFFEDLVVFDVVQHTADYTAGYTLEETQYLGDLITLPTFDYSGLGNIQQFTEFFTDGVITYSGPILYNLNGLYWNGGIWTSSNDSEVQMNLFDIVDDNITVLPASDTVTIKMRTLDSSSQMGINVLDLTYTAEGYSTGNPGVTPKNALLTRGVNDFLVVKSVIGSDEIKFTQDVSGVEKYWDLANWSNSDGYAHSNFDNVVNSNIGTLDLSNGELYKPIIYLHSDDGSTTPSITSITFEYIFQGAFPEIPDKTIVFGFVYFPDDTPSPGVTVSATLDQKSIYGKEILLDPKELSTTTNAKGYWELQLMETISMVPTSSYTFKFTGSSITFEVKKKVKNNISQNFAELDNL